MEIIILRILLFGISWIIFCFVAGIVGNSREIGFFRPFLLSFFLSPLVGVIIAFNSDKIDVSKRENLAKKILTTLLIILVFSGVVIGGGITLNHFMYSGARDLTTEKTEYVVSSKDIVDEFIKNPTTANKKYLEKAVAIKGIVSNVEGTQVILDNSVNCGFKSHDNSVKVGQLITVKGRIIGYDDLMEELKMDECFIDNN